MRAVVFGVSLVVFFNECNGWVPSTKINGPGRLLNSNSLPRTVSAFTDVFEDRLSSVTKQVMTAAILSVLVLFPPAVQTRMDFPTVPIAHAMTNPVKGDEVVEEAWGIVNKYAIDRTFGGQDWGKVRQKYIAEAQKANGDEAKVMNLLTEMIGSLGDKYTRILDPNAYAAIQKYDLIGVGVTLMMNDDKEMVVENPPIPGSAALKAGLQAGDKIVAVNGEPTQGRTAFDIINQISEKPDAPTITMTVARDDGKREVEMKRQTQEGKNPIRYKLAEKRSDGTNVGYIRISEFNAQVKQRLEEALSELNSQGANAYVIDLRLNGGGAFQSAVEISSFFMNEKVATYVVDSKDVKLTFKTANDKMLIDPSVPVVVWIDGTTASASEVFAGSLHDNCRAVLMGSKSFGKGVIQAVYGLQNGAGMVLTVARYVTPNGSDIQGVGITPDVSVTGLSALPLPVLGENTSGVDFNDIRSRLDTKVCQAPVS